MTDRSDLLKLLVAIEEHKMVNIEAGNLSEANDVLYELAKSTRQKLDAQEKAEAEDAAQHGEGPLAPSGPYSHRGY